MPREIDRISRANPYIIPAQLFAALLADAKGLDPESHVAFKVTRTL